MLIRARSEELTLLNPKIRESLFTYNARILYPLKSPPSPQRHSKPDTGVYHNHDAFAAIASSANFDNSKSVL